MISVKIACFCLFVTLSTCQRPPGSPEGRWDRLNHEMSQHQPHPQPQPLARNFEHPDFALEGPEAPEGPNSAENAENGIAGVDRSAGPEDTPEAIKADVDRDMQEVNAGDRGHPQVFSRLNELFGKPPVKRDVPHDMNFRGPHMRRDEELFLWNLNNFGRQQESLRQEVPQDAQNAPRPQPTPPEQSGHFEPDEEIPEEDPFEDTEALIPLDEIHGNKVPEEAGFSIRTAENPILTRPHPRHFGHFHHKSLGFHSSHDGFNAGPYGSSAPSMAGHGVGGLVGPFGKFGRPTEITINNQQNTFTNAVPTSAGNANYQISQSTGQAGSSQSHSASNNGQHHAHGGHGHGFRAAEEEQRNDKSRSNGPSSRMQMMRSNLRMTSQTVVPVEPVLGQAQDMHLADHFLGTRGLMPAASGSTMMIQQSNQQTH